MKTACFIIDQGDEKLRGFSQKAKNKKESRRIGSSAPA
jgi:hypothetical protein